MKASPLFVPLLLALGFATASQGFAAKVQFIALTEPGETAPVFSAPTAEQPLAYLAYDGGYIEAGDPVAGEQPPIAADVGRHLHSALAAQHYTPATLASAPALVLVYHWGVIRRDSMAIQPPSRLSPNLRARLALVAPARLVDRIEQRLVSERYIRTPASFVTFPDQQDALDQARTSRYFIVVSAYDYTALAEGRELLVWRTHLSAPDNSGAMDQTLFTLIEQGAGYLGRTSSRPISATAPLAAAPASSASPGDSGPAFPREFTAKIESSLLHSLIAREHRIFSGEYVAATANRPARRPSARYTSPLKSFRQVRTAAGVTPVAVHDHS